MSSASKHEVRIVTHETITDQINGLPPWGAECSCGWSRDTNTRDGAQAAAREHEGRS